MVIKKDTFFSMLGFIVMIIVTGIVYSESIQRVFSVSSSLYLLGGLALLCLSVTCFLLFNISKHISYFIFFIILAYMFFFGQSILIFLGEDLPLSPFSITNSGFTSNEILKSGFYSLFGIYFTCFGYCLVIKEKLNNQESFGVLKNSKIVAKVGWILIWFSVLPTFYLLVKEIIVLLNQGYANTLGPKIGFDKILSLISDFFISGLLMVFSFEQKSKKRIILYILLIIYCGLQLLGGSRISVFRIGITFLVIYNCFIKRIDRKQSFYIVIIGLVCIFFFSLVSSIRIYMSNSIDLVDLLKRTIDNIWANNFIFSSIREMGGTQILNTLVYSKTPSVIPFQYGLSFLKAISGIFPNLMGNNYTGYVGIDITFSPLYTLTTAGLGASYIAEGYWNFGPIFSFVYFVCFGVFLGYIENVFIRYCNLKKGNAIIFYLLTYIMYYMIFMVRGELILIGRSFVYYGLLPALLCVVFKDNFFTKKRKKL